MPWPSQGDCAGEQLQVVQLNAQAGIQAGAGQRLGLHGPLGFGKIIDLSLKAGSFFIQAFDDGHQIFRLLAGERAQISQLGAVLDGDQQGEDEQGDEKRHLPFFIDHYSSPVSAATG